MDQMLKDVSRGVRVSSGVFLTVEHGIYIAIGVLLSLTAMMALISAVGTLWAAMTNWSGEGLLIIMDRTLFVLMLAEILHTVRVSIRDGALTCEPFLTVGLIASIRRVLVITLESSQSASGKGVDAGEAFRTSMIELGVLAGLILIMVVSIYLIRASNRRAFAPRAHPQ